MGWIMLSFPPSLESLVKEGYANPEVLNQDLLNNALEGKASDNITFVTLVIAPLWTKAGIPCVKQT